MNIERDVQQLLANTRREADMYESAAYRDPDAPGAHGLNMRLSAIEDALLRLASAIDDVRSA